MRALWLSHVVPFPPKAGVLLRAYHLLRSVAAEHDVDLVAFVQRPLLQTFYADVDAGLDECRRALAPLCRSVTFLPIDRADRALGRGRTAFESLVSRNGYMATWLDSPRAWVALAEAISARQYNVAHFDHLSLATYRPLLGATPATLGHHNAESHMMLRRAEREANALKRVYFGLEAARLKRFESEIANQFDLHITCSNLDSDRLRKTMPGARLRAVPNGVDTQFFAPTGIPANPESLIFIGTMNWYPNIDAVMFLLEEIWPKLLSKRPNVTLDIVGAGAPKSIVQLARNLPGVALHGFVPEIRPMMERAALYVCPIRDGGGTKLKILDALSMARCVVAHPVACEGIDVTHGTTVVFAEHAEDFVTRIVELLHAPDRRLAIGRAARELAEARYSFSAIGADFTVALEQVAAQAECPLTA
jgi:polysaccharide biosynthesis protein PslH